MVPWQEGGTHPGEASASSTAASVSVAGHYLPTECNRPDSRRRNCHTAPFVSCRRHFDNMEPRNLSRPKLAVLALVRPEVDRFWDRLVVLHLVEVLLEVSTSYS